MYEVEYQYDYKGYMSNNEVATNIFHKCMILGSTISCIEILSVIALKWWKGIKVKYFFVLLWWQNKKINKKRVVNNCDVEVWYHQMGNIKGREVIPLSPVV